MLFISKFTVAKQIVTVLLVNFGRRDNLEGVEVHNPPQSCLPRSLGFLVLVIVIGSALKKLFDLMVLVHHSFQGYGVNFINTLQSIHKTMKVKQAKQFLINLALNV